MNILDKPASAAGLAIELGAIGIDSDDTKGTEDLTGGSDFDSAIAGKRKLTPVATHKWSVSDCVSLARSARNAFRDSITLPEGDAEATFASCKSRLKQLWDFQAIRDQPFRDLLALLDGTLRHSGLADFATDQRTEIAAAFDDLTKPFVEHQMVIRHLDAFQDLDIDSTPPLEMKPGRKLKFAIVEDE